jgi:FdhD protein
MKRAGSTTTAAVWKVQGGAPREEMDRLAGEEPMEIRVESGPRVHRETTSLSVTMRTPGQDFELAAGFLFTEGIVSRPRDILRIEYCTDPGVEQEFNIVSAVLRPGLDFRSDRLTRHFYMTSSCGVCGKTALEAIRVAVRHPIAKDRPVLDPTTLARIPDRLREGQELFAETGGLHAAGLFDPAGERSSLREDVGRHNAVDKVIGEAFLADRVPLSESVLGVSGRGSFEILQKAAVAGIPFVVAVGAPSNLAVAIAEEFGMTLVGFARGDRFNVYTGRHRIRGLAHEALASRSGQPGRNF